MKEKRVREGLAKKVAERKANTHTEFKPGEPEIARLLLDRLPPEMVTAAKVYLDVIRSQEEVPEPWFNEDVDNSASLSPERARLLTQAKDLLFRSFWFADEHTLSPEELKAIFQLSGIHDLHFTNPVAKALHEEPQNWSPPEKGYQDQVHQRYLGPYWVIKELDINFSKTDLQNLVFYMLNQTGELIEDRSLSLHTRFKLSPSLAKKIKLLLS